MPTGNDHLRPLVGEGHGGGAPDAEFLPEIKTTGLPMIYSLRCCPALTGRAWLNGTAGSALEIADQFHARCCEVQVSAPGAIEKDFVSSAACLADMEGRYGATPPSLFRRGRGGRKPDGRRREDAAHGAAFAEPPNPRSRIRGRRSADEPQRARHRINRRRARLSRSCAVGAYSGGGSRGGGAAGGSTRQADLRSRVSHRERNRLVA